MAESGRDGRELLSAGWATSAEMRHEPKGDVIKGIERGKVEGEEFMHILELVDIFATFVT